MAEREEKTRERSEFMATEVTPDVRAAVEEIAREDDRSLSYTIWKLLSESPRVRKHVARTRAAEAQPA